METCMKDDERPGSLSSALFEGGGAEIVQEAFGAFWFARDAGFASEQHPLMIDRPPALAGIELEQILFGLQGSVSIGELQAVRNAEHVCIDRDAFDDAEPFVQYDVRRLPAYARKLLKAFHVTGYFATEIAHDHLSACNAILRFIAEESERMEDIGNLFHIRLRHGLGRSETGEQGRGYLIHVHVGGLCGKSDRDREFEGCPIMKCAFGLGIVFAHAALDFECASKFIRFLLSCHSCPFACISVLVL